MRVFVAVELCPDVLDALTDFVSVLRGRAEAVAPRAKINWVRRNQFHVTSRFIGEVTEETAGAIADALRKPSLSPFDITVRGAGAYPERGAPRVLWAGIGAGADALTAVERDVSARLTLCGVPAEKRPYRPHVTLARVREPAGLRPAMLLDDIAGLEFGTSRVDAITLFKSRTSPTGALYTPIHRTQLR